MQFDTAPYLRLDALQVLDRSASGAAFATSTGDIFEVSCYGPGVFRLRAGPDTKPDYGLVVTRSKSCTVTPGDGGTTTFTSGETSVEIGASPLRFQLRHRGAEVTQSITDEPYQGGTRLPAFGRLRQGGHWIAAVALVSGEPLYGLGEKFGPLNKRGQLLHSGVVAAHDENTGLASKNAPFAWSPGTGKGAWGVFVNTPATVTHGVGHPGWSHRSYAIAVADEAIDLFLFAADTPAGLLDLYTQLTGRPAPVPLWGLGLWISRTSLATPAQAAEAAARLRARKVPCDVMMLDGRMTWRDETRAALDWSPKRFPDPSAALAAIKGHDMKVCVSEHPYVSVLSPRFADLASRGYLLSQAGGDPYVVALSRESQWSSSNQAEERQWGIIDFTHPGAHVWWRDSHAAIFADGVDAVRCDSGVEVPGDAMAFNGDTGRRLHNVYPLLYNQCVFDATRRFQRGTGAPAMAWGSAGWTGSQRYPIQEGGDSQSDWEGLAASIRGGLSWGMSGVPYHSSNIGGGYGTQHVSSELSLRWLQAAVFSSHIAIHGDGDHEPWSFGADAEAIARKWLTFRYRLIPYLQGAIAQAVATGMPVARAMALAFPDTSLTRSYETQFMCGDALLVAPIVQGGGEVEVALPPGAWYDLNSRQRFPGRRLLRYKATLDQFPAFGREGFALPLGRAVQHTGEIDIAKPLEQLWVFGPPAQSLETFAQARIVQDASGVYTIRATAEVRIEYFGDATGIDVGLLE